MLAVRSAVPATYAVREFVEIGGKFCGADRSPLQAYSSTGSSTEVSGKKCRWGGGAALLPLEGGGGREGVWVGSTGMLPKAYPCYYLL